MASQIDKGGRPRAEIDWKVVDDLLISGCSGREVAAYIGLNPQTIYENCVHKFGISFSEYSTQKYSKGDSILRAQQYAKALGKTDKGDNTLLIWLGKNRLKQRERDTDDIERAMDQLEKIKPFLDQIESLQSSRKIDSKSIDNEQKSACETGCDIAEDGNRS